MSRGTRALRGAFVALSAALLAAPVTVRAEEAGCTVTATGHPTMRGNCRYVAIGPGVFSVRTVSGYRIMVSDDSGVSWRTLAARVAQPNQLITGVEVREGPLDTRAGQLVDISIGVSWLDTPSGKHRFQDGTISASSEN